MLRACIGAGISLSLGLLPLLAPSPGRATTWYVDASGSGDFPTIQGAVDGSSPGDTVLVGPGTYTAARSLFGWTANLFPKAGITLVSSDGPEVTILDAGSLDSDHRTVVFARDASGYATLIGFTLRGGRAERGAGVHASGAKLILRDCDISGNVATRAGGGLLVENGSILLEGCRIHDNRVTGPSAVGGGVCLEGVLAEIASSVFFANRVEAPEPGGWARGGGLADEASKVFVHHTVFYGNLSAGSSRSRGAAVYVSGRALGREDVNPYSVYVGNTFACNRALLTGDATESFGFGGSAIYFHDYARASFHENLVVGNECDGPALAGSGPAAGGAGVGSLGAISRGRSAVVTNGCNLFWMNVPRDFQNIDPGGGTILTDPLFCGGVCGASSIDQIALGLDSASPALPPNNACGVLIGALGDGGGCLEVACGVHLEAPHALAGKGGDVLDFVFQVTNTGDAADTYALAASETHKSWRLDHPDSVGPIPPGTTVPVTVTLFIPSWADWRTQHFVTLKAWSDCAAQDSATTLAAVDVVVQSSSLRPTADAVEIRWTVSGRLGGERFDLYRAPARDVEPVRIGPEGGVRVDVRGEGLFLDRRVEPGGRYTYYLGIHEPGAEERRVFLGETRVPSSLFRLDPNVPNPFNPSTSITFHLPAPARVDLAIFDPGGRRVVTIATGLLPAGRHTVTWNGLDAAGRPAGSGVYFYRLRAGKERATRKMLLMK